MTDRLSIYNAALRHCKTRALASLTENREPRRQLDAVWDDGGVKACLEKGLWRFATRSQMLDYESAIEPDFGYQYAFTKPDDYVRTAAVCTDEFFNNPLTQYVDESGYWYAPIQTIYVQYVSDDAAYGTNYAIWPESFTEYVGLYFAEQIAGVITQSQTIVDGIKRDAKKALTEARSRDAMNQPTKFLPQGAWVKSRRGNSYSNRSYRDL